MWVNLEGIFNKCLSQLDRPVVAVETGCAFQWSPDVEQYLSTSCIVQHLVAPTGGILYSLDINPERIEICRTNLVRLGIEKYVKFILGDSVESMKNMDVKDVNFVWLDSSEESAHAEAEYTAIQRMLSKKHIICVDDYDCPNSVKWQTVSGIIKNSFDSYDTYKTPTGLIVGYRSRI